MKGKIDINSYTEYIEATLLDLMPTENLLNGFSFRFMYRLSTKSQFP